MRHLPGRSRFIYVFVLSALFAAPVSGWAAEGGGLKANLDLPFEAASIQEEQDSWGFIYVCRQMYMGDGFFFCVDRSGDEGDGGGARWRDLQRELVKVISQLSDHVEFGIVLFDEGLLKFPASGRPVNARAAERDSAIAFLRAAGPGRGSCVKAGLSAALDYAEYSKADRRVILYAGGGETDCPGCDPAVYGKSTLAEVEARNSARVEIDVVRFSEPCPMLGDAAEREWAKNLAALNRGSYFEIRISR
jgi:hypothetical protein